MLISSFIQPNTNQSERYNIRGNSDVGMKTDHLSFFSLLSYEISTSEL